MAKRQVRKINKTTLLIMGEGEHDKAFLEHMKGIYYDRQSGSKIRLDFSGGGSPHDIIKDTIKKSRHVAYDRKIILMDDDIEIYQQDQNAARNASILILQSTPICLEGMLLNVLGEKIPTSAQKCKGVLHPLLSGRPTLAKSYEPLFPKPVLDAAKNPTIISLRSLLTGKAQK